MTHKYDVSCSELDDLVARCKQAGAVGCRIAGAGWGGCCLSIVPKSKLDCFIADMLQYYEERGLEKREVLGKLLIEAKAGRGAFIMKS